MANYKTHPIINIYDRRFFVYTRISTKDWSYEKSLEQQLEVCKIKATQHNISELNLDTISEQASWYSWDRPQFDEMIRRLKRDSERPPEKRQYGWIIFYKIDRLARNSADFQDLDILLNEWYKLISTTEVIENTPTGKLLFRMLCAFAIFESEKLSWRMILSQIHSILHSRFRSCGWTLPFWYYYSSSSSNKKNQSLRDWVTQSNEEKGVDNNDESKPEDKPLTEVKTKFKKKIDYEESIEDNDFVEHDDYLDIDHEWKSDQIKIDKRMETLLNEIYLKYKECKDVSKTWRYIKLKYPDLIKWMFMRDWVKFNSTSTTLTNTERSFFTKKLDNYKHWLIKYNGYYVKSFNVKDESISNVISSLLSNNNNNDLEVNSVEWLTNQKIVLELKIPELTIINPVLYSEVVSIRRAEVSQKKNTVRWILDELIYWDNWSWTQIQLYPDSKKSGKYIYYRLRAKESWSSDENFSELKIVDMIFNSDQFKRLLGWVFRDKVDSLYKGFVIRQFTRNSMRRKKQLVMLKNNYQWLIDLYEHCIELDNEGEEVNLGYISEYTFKKQAIENELRQIEDQFESMYQWFLAMFDIDKRSNPELIKMAINIFVDRIVIINKEVFIYFKKRVSEELWFSHRESIGTYV